MKLELFCVHDQAAGAYLEPFFQRSRGEAVRAFTDAVNTDGHSFNRHPEDYTLFHSGSFEQETGELHSMVPVSLGNALDYLKRPKLAAAGGDA